MRSVRTVVAAVAICGLGAGPAYAAPVLASEPAIDPGSSAGTGAWTVYHGDAAGTGVAAGVVSVDTAARAWTSPALDGQIYGEPLVDGGFVFVATENDTVYALSASTGAIDWSSHVDTPVPAGSLPCGNISPTVGITGTPVIDPARQEIFVVADTGTAGRPAHMLVGLSTASGKVELRQDVDPPGDDPAALLQRTGLALDAGQVVFAMGGNFGDCGRYHGQVAGVPETGGSPRFFTVDSAAGDSQGAIWMGGAAPVVDAQGNIWVAPGNGSVTTPGQAYDDSDGVLELSSTLRLKQYFAPSDWAAQNASDLDMSTAPVLLASGQVLVAGKSGTAYLLDGSHLGGIGGQQAILKSACGTVIDGGTAVSGTTVFLPCLQGIVAVQATPSPPGLRLLWSSGTGGGPPIVAAGLVWTIGQDGVLYGLSPATGKVQQQVTLGTPANHFPTPSVGDGLLLAACAANVVAFPVRGSASSQAPTAAQGAACEAYSPPAPGISRRYIAAAGLGGLVVLLAVCALAWFMLRRRRRQRAAAPS
jgi:outer membrane protein assembly factor BamB